MSQKKLSELGLFDTLSKLQKSTPELVLWCPLANQLVKVAYPMTRGKRIEPRGVSTWMQRRKIRWVCMCPADGLSEIRSCRIVVAVNGNVYAFCAKNPSRCNFFINITKAHADAVRESEYLAIPTSMSTTVPDMEGLKKRFLDTVVLSDVLPYFEGYFGELESMHPGIAQVNDMVFPFTSFRTGPMHVQTGVNRVPRSISDRRLRYSPLAYDVMAYDAPALTSTIPNEAGPSRIQDEATRPTILSTAHYDLLATLGRGGGISSWDRDYLFETCDSCNSVFVSSAIREHYKSCQG